MLDEKLKNLQRFLQDASDTAFEYSQLCSKHTTIHTNYNTLFQNNVTSKRSELSLLLNNIATAYTRNIQDEPDDWFFNSKTGEVYYNSSYKKGNENLLGENWEYLGENRLFGSDDIKLLNNFNVSGNFEAITGYLNPKEAQKFMKKQGYNFNPVQEVIYKKRIILFNNPNTPIPVDIVLKFEIIEKSKYMTSDYYRTDAEIPIDNQKMRNDIPFNLSDPAVSSSQEEISRSKIIYDNNKYLRILSFTVNTIFPSMSSAVFKSWDDYQIDKTNELLGKFIERYGKE